MICDKIETTVFLKNQKLLKPDHNQLLQQSLITHGSPQPRRPRD